MRPHNRGVDHAVFVIRISGKYLEDTLPHTAFCPTTMTAVNILPIAKTLR
jgi:hypothetical protein